MLVERAPEEVAAQQARGFWANLGTLLRDPEASLLRCAVLCCAAPFLCCAAFAPLCCYALVFQALVCSVVPPVLPASAAHAQPHHMLTHTFSNIFLVQVPLTCSTHTRGLRPGRVLTYSPTYLPTFLPT